MKQLELEFDTEKIDFNGLNLKKVLRLGKRYKCFFEPTKLIGLKEGSILELGRVYKGILEYSFIGFIVWFKDANGFIEYFFFNKDFKDCKLIDINTIDVIDVDLCK